MHIIDFFEIIHIYEGKTAIILLHQGCYYLLTTASHVKSCQIINAIGFFLTAHGLHNLRYESVCHGLDKRIITVALSRRIVLIYHNHAIVKHINKHTRNLRIKLSAAVIQKLPSDFFIGQCIPVNPARPHGIIAVCHTNYTGRKWYLLSHQSVRITISIVTLMMTPCNIHQMV